MGRYYTSQTGRGGKFMFGVQASDDPAELGMRELENNYIRFYADKDDKEEIKKKLDKQYDTLGVPIEKRIYLLPEKEDVGYWDWEDEVLHDLVFKTYHEKKDKAELERLEKQARKEGKLLNRWSNGKDFELVDIEIDGAKTLALARVRLALTILTDLEDEGYCELEAEL